MIRRGVGRRAFGWVLALAHAVAASWAPAVPAQTPQATVPQAWIGYAQQVGQQFQAWLDADSEPANVLHAYLEERGRDAPGDASPPSVSIRAWIGADGNVERIQFDSLGDPKADAALHGLLAQHRLSAPPPADMLQPLRVRLQLELNPDVAASEAERRVSDPH